MSFSDRVKQRQVELERNARDNAKAQAEDERFKNLLIQNRTTRLKSLWLNDVRYERLVYFENELRNNHELQEALSIIWEKWDVRNWLLPKNEPVCIKYFMFPSDNEVIFSLEHERYSVNSDNEDYCYPLPTVSNHIRHKEFLTDDQLKVYFEWKIPFLAERSPYIKTQNHLMGIPKDNIVGCGLHMQPDQQKHQVRGSKIPNWWGMQIGLNIRNSGEEFIDISGLAERFWNKHPKFEPYNSNTARRYRCKSSDIRDILEFLVEYVVFLG